jgi:hypothetical protein
MNNKKKIIFMTMIGLLGAATAANASSLAYKVSGLLRNDVNVSVNGQPTSMKPVIINGQVYLPAKSEAAALGYTFNYNEPKKSITITKPATTQPAKPPVSTPVEYLRSTGVIVDVKQATNGQYRIELLGKGNNSWVILYADKDTVIKNKDGKTINVKDLKKGMKIDAQYGPTVAQMYPVESHAAQINVSSETLIREDVIQAVKHTADGWVVQFGEAKGGTLKPTLTLTSGKETSVLSPEGQSINWEDIKVGNKVRVYYGPDYTKSQSPQGPLYYMIVLDNYEMVDPDYLPADVIKGFRDLAWKQLEDKSHVTTKQNEAKVEYENAIDSGVIAKTNAQQKSLSALQSANGKLIKVTYNTDQDALLGPISLAFNPNTKEFVGYYPRR